MEVSVDDLLISISTNCVSFSGSSSKELHKIKDSKITFDKALTAMAELVKLSKSNNITQHRQALELLIGPSVDRVTSLLIAAGNFLNGRTNIDGIDRYMTSFISLFSADGVLATNTYSTLYMSFWVIYDSIGWIYRFNENRHNDRQDEKAAAAQLAQDVEAVAGMIETLNVANTRLEAFSKSIQLIICENAGGVRRDGKVLIKRHGVVERQIDCPNLLKRRAGDDSNNIETEDKREKEEKEEKEKEEEEEEGEQVEEEEVEPDELVGISEEMFSPSKEKSQFNPSNDWTRKEENNNKAPEALEQRFEENDILD